MKKLIATLVAVTLFFSLTSSALAVDPPKAYSSVPTEGTPAEGNVGSAEGQLRFAPMDVSIHIYIWRNSIEEISSGYLKLYGYTETDLIADKVETDYYLQRWDGSTWVNISSSLNYEYDSDSLSLNIYRYVSHGYYYRVKTVHRGWYGTTYDERTLYSSYIYVS